MPTAKVAVQNASGGVIYSNSTLSVDRHVRSACPRGAPTFNLGNGKAGLMQEGS